MLTQFIVDTNLDVVNGSDGLTSLREAITAANSNAGADTIDFTGTFGAFEPIVLSLGELTITEGLTINGSTAFSLSVEVDGDDLSRVFNIDTTDAVTFIGVDVTGGAAVDGAGIFNNGSDLTYQFGMISNNNATGSGGGIFNAAGTVSIEQSNINDNTAVRAGGGIEDQSNDANAITFTNGNLNGNSATGGVAGPGNGGGLHVTGSGNVTITNVSVTGNTAASEGGGLWNGTGTMTISDTSGNVLIDGNTASGNDANNGGGGIFNAGGTVLIQDNDPTNTITISNNIADGTSGSGGGILNDAGGTLTVTGATISGNAANRAGGGIESTAGTTNTLTSVTLIDNVAGRAGSASPGNGGGLHITGNGNADIMGGSVTGNFAASEGGGLWNGTGTMTIDGTMITGNAAAGNGADQGGGGVFNAGGTLDIDNATISNNLAAAAITFSLDGNQVVPPVSTSASGSAIAQLDPATGTFRLDLFVTGMELPTNPGGLPDLTMANVHLGAAGVNGPVIFDLLALGSFVQEDNGLRLILDGEVFPEDSLADLLAGNTYVNIQSDDNMSGEIRGQIIVPSTMGSGGGILNDQGTLTVDNSTIDGNIASRAGGGIETNVGTTTLTNVTLSNNVAGPDGAATPGNGGGLHVTGAGGVTINGGMVTGNTAAAEGGGLWNSSTGTMTIQAGGMGGTLIDSNTANGDGAVQGGGGIFNVGGTLSITDATISNNVSTATQAGNGGGGILIEGGANNSITDTTISGNTANTSGTADGGGILLTGGSTLTISGGTISGNSANRAGGGIENNASTVTLTDVTLGGVMVADGNNAGVNGGGLHVSGAGTTNVNGGTVQNNVAGQEGGGLWNATGTMTIDGTTISGNSANAGNNGGNDQGGGGVFNIGGTLDIDNATITGNFATVNAGNGGGVMTVGGTVTIDDSTISGNSVARAGGGIENNNGMLTLTGVIVGGTMVSDGNSAGVNGGGLHVTGSGTTNVNGGAFELNTAAQEGGGLWNGTGTMTIDGVAILQNVASGNGADQGGGGVFNAGGEVIIQNGTTISRNVANGTSGSGGGILNDAGGTLTVSDSTIELNTANRAGGGIEDNSGQFSVVELTNVTLDGNSAGVDIGVVVMAAPGNGGGLHVTGAGVVNIFDGTVNNNVAAAEGGGLWNNTGQMDVVGTTISGNTAFGTGVDEGGGGIFNKGGDLDVQSATLSGNTATSGFGAAIFNEGGTVAIGMTTLDGDVAGGDLTDDTFDIFETSVTIISQGGSDTTIVSGDATDDSFVVTPDTAGLGATVTVQNGSAFTINTDSETLNLLGDIGDDDFTVDFGNAVTLGTVTNLSIGGAGETSADSLTLTGTGSFVDVTQTTTTAVDGSFSLNTDKIVVDYSSIESIINNLLEGLSLAQTPDQVIGAGAGSVDILIASSTDDSEIPVLTVGALPDYASFVDNGNGTGVLTLNPATGDASTNADITVTATIAGLSASDTFNVAVVSPAQAFPNNTIFAVNSAGGAVGNFSSDSNFNTGSTFSTGAAIDVSDSSIPSGTPAGIFKTTRFDFNGGSELQYAFPTGVGNFEVTLFFAEIYSPVFRAGGRVFDVSIEGVLELDDFDVFAQAGAGNKGIARTFQVVSDGTLNIDFGHVVENPMVMGIQIVDLNPVANAGPQVASVAPVVNLLSGNSTTIDVSATDLEGDSIALSVTGLPEFASFVDNGNGTGTITVSSAATDEGLFGVTVQATSGTPALTDSASFTLSVAPFVPQPLPQEVININAGGPALPGDPGFVRDDNFQNGVGLDFGTGATIDTSDASIPSGTPAQLFNTVTFDRAGGAELQLDIPTQHTGIAYEVTLYFVEIYGPTARTGARVFDVSIDGQLVLDNFDVFAAAGAINRGIARTFQITSDGNVDIDFGHVTENPALAGVSVRQIDQVFSSAP